MSSPRLHLAPPAPVSPEPLSPATALTLARLRERRAELAEHSPAGLTVAADALAAMHAAAWGHVPAVRCDRQLRYREAQLQAERALPIEDLAAMTLEGPEGLAVVLAGLRVLARACGYALTPLAPCSIPVSEATARVVETSGSLGACLTRAMADGEVDTNEARSIEPLADHLRRDVEALSAIIARRVAAWKEGRV